MTRSGGEVGRLLTELRDTDPIRRDIAIARLRIIGTRATDALSALALDTVPATVRAAALKALEGIDDPHAVTVAVQLIEDPEEPVAAAAAGILRQWVTREEGTRVLDALTRAALDGSRHGSVRVAAVEALTLLPMHVVAPVLEQAAVAAPLATSAADPSTVLDWLSASDTAPLSELHELIVRLGALERQEPSSSRRDEWSRARGAAHAALAARRSRVALYDLRETFDSSTRTLPADYLRAISAVGDGSCLEPLARAWSASAEDGWWRTRLVEAAAAIVRREKLSGKNAVVRRIKARWPGFL